MPVKSPGGLAGMRRLSAAAFAQRSGPAFMSGTTERRQQVGERLAGQGHALSAAAGRTAGTAPPQRRQPGRDVLGVFGIPAALTADRPCPITSFTLARGAQRSVRLSPAARFIRSPHNAQPPANAHADQPPLGGPTSIQKVEALAPRYFSAKLWPARDCELRYRSVHRHARNVTHSIRHYRALSAC
jgi:hypothetical protein